MPPNVYVIFGDGLGWEIGAGWNGYDSFTYHTYVITEGTDVESNVEVVSSGSL